MSKEQVKQEAQKIAQLWEVEGQEAAVAAFRSKCKEWKLVYWEQIAFSDAVHEARKEATRD